METLRNSVEIYQGEAFTLDKIIKNEDGTPYIIPKIENPYFLISLDSVSYLSTNTKFSRKYWLPISKTFYETQPIKLSDLKFSEYGECIKDFTEITKLPVTLYYKDGYYEFTDENIGVFTNNEIYKYPSIINDSGDVEWLLYSCRLIKYFSSEETFEWPSSLYMYSIVLVSGKPFDDDTQPIHIDYSVPILKPSELKVLNYVKGG